VQPGQQAADPFEHLGVVELGGGRRRGETEKAKPAWWCRLSLQPQRAHGGHLGGHQLGGKRVFLEDLRLAPAARAVELGHHAGMALHRFFEWHLVDPVLVRRQGGQAAVAVQADAGQRIQHGVGHQAGVGVAGIVGGRGHGGFIRHGVIVHRGRACARCRPELMRIKRVAAAAPHNRAMVQRRRRRHVRFISRRGLLYSLLLAFLMMSLGGLGFWIVEPRVESYWDGLWLAFTTAATVGYGDIVPTTHWSKAFAVAVVLLGLAVLSLVTASVAAMLVEVDERAADDRVLQELRELRASVQALQAELRPSAPAGRGVRGRRLSRPLLRSGPHSGSMPAALMMRPHFCDSAAWNLRCSSGVLR
jgi:voltage-gated potassium channel